MSETSPPPSQLPRSLWFGLLSSTLAAALVFSLWPELDLYTSSLFYLGKGHFFLVGNPLGTWPRSFFIMLFVAFCALSLVGLTVSLIARKPFLHLKALQWGYLVACLLLGPGLLTNSILKDYWGRARPVQTEQFGAYKKFTPALVPSNACDHNCSFVSGESSSIYMMFFSLALLLANYRKKLIMVGMLVGSLAGLVRMGMGGHFLSDVTFSAIFMMATASGLYWLFFTSRLSNFGDLDKK